MKKIFSLFLAVSAIFVVDRASAQGSVSSKREQRLSAAATPPASPPKASSTAVTLVSDMQFYTPVYVADSANGVTKVITQVTIPVTLMYPTSSTFTNDTVWFTLDSHDLPGSPSLSPAWLVVSSSTDDPESKGYRSEKRTVTILTDALQTPLDKDHFGVLSIVGQSGTSVLVGCKKKDAAPPKIQERGKIVIDNSPVNIVKQMPINELITIPVTLSGTCPDTPAKFVFVLDTSVVRSLAISPADTVQYISVNTWNEVVSNKSGKYNFQLHIISNGRTDTSANTETAFISIAGVPGQAQEVDLVNYDPEQPFWVEVGANFDLASQHLQTNNLFGGIFLYKKDITPVFNHQGSSNLAIAAGVYESKNFSQNTSISSFKVHSYLDSTSYTPGHGDTVARAYTDSGSVKMTSQIRNIGLFFSPQVRLTNKDASEDGIHLFASFYAEMLWQDVQVNYDYTNTRRLDTQYLSRTTVNNFAGKTTSRDINYYSHYEGFGVPLFFKYNDANLYLNPVFGATNQPSTQDINNAINNLSDAVNKKWRGFYLVQFRLSEEKYGISFSGEIRQVIGANSQPYITLVLSKKFVLSKLINFE